MSKALGWVTPVTERNNTWLFVPSDEITIMELLFLQETYILPVESVTRHKGSNKQSFRNSQSLVPDVDKQNKMFEL